MNFKSKVILPLPNAPSPAKFAEVWRARTSALQEVFPPTGKSFVSRNKAKLRIKKDGRRGDKLDLSFRGIVYDNAICCGGEGGGCEGYSQLHVSVFLLAGGMFLRELYMGDCF